MNKVIVIYTRLSWFTLDRGLLSSSVNLEFSYSSNCSKW